jgi:hypothetical protein
MASGVKVFSWGMSGPVASRPTIVREGDYKGQSYLAEDEDKLYFSDGDEWLEVNTPEGTTIGTAQIADGAVTKAKLAGGFSKVSVVDGEDETSTHQITVTGMAAGDEVVAVLVLTTKASIATMAAHAGVLTAAAGKITPGTEVDNTGNQYIVFWNDLT